MRMATTKEPSVPAERRRVPRIAVDFPVEIMRAKKQYRFQAQEFSEYGILVASPNREMVGEDVQVRLPLNPNGEALTIDGVVAYAASAALGIRFKNVSPEDQFTLRSYAHSHGIGIARPPA